MTSTDRKIVAVKFFPPTSLPFTVSVGHKLPWELVPCDDAAFSNLVAEEVTHFGACPFLHLSDGTKVSVSGFGGYAVYEAEPGSAEAPSGTYAK